MSLTQAPRCSPGAELRRPPLPHSMRGRGSGWGSGCAVTGLVPALHSMLVGSRSSPTCRVCPSPSARACHFPAPVRQAGFVVSCGPSRCPEIRPPWSPREVLGMFVLCLSTGAAAPRCPPSSRGSATLRSLSCIGALVVVVSDYMELARVKILSIFRKFDGKRVNYFKRSFHVETLRIAEQLNISLENSLPGRIPAGSAGAGGCRGGCSGAGA